MIDFGLSEQPEEPKKVVYKTEKNMPTVSDWVGHVEKQTHTHRVDGLS